MRYFLLALVLGLAAPAFAQDDPAAPADETIIATLEADGRFSTLLGAIEATNLTETLRGVGPFTLFAPTDDAFAALPEGTVEALTPEQLQGILLYHVVGGAVDGATAAAAGQAPTAFGETTLAFAPTEDGGLTVNGVAVTEADLVASNGVVHVVDGVLLPPADDEADGGMDHDEMDDGTDGP